MIDHPDGPGGFAGISGILYRWVGEVDSSYLLLFYQTQTVSREMIKIVVGGVQRKIKV